MANENEQKVEVPRRWVPWLVIMLMLAGIGLQAVVGGSVDRVKMIFWEIQNSWNRPGVG